MIKFRKTIGGAESRPLRSFNKLDFGADDRDFMISAYRICVSLMNEGEQERWHERHRFFARDNPGQGQMGLQARDQHGAEICTFWISGAGIAARNRVRSARAAGPPMRPEAPHVQLGFAAPPPGSTADKLGMARQLLRHYHNMLSIAGIAVPGNFQQQYDEVFR